MTRLIVAAALSIASLCTACASTGHLPLASGEYSFRQRYAEHPDMPGIRLKVILDGNRIVVSNPTGQAPFPAGTLEEGTVERHAKSGQWIIVRTPADREAEDVGGCSDGPTVIDLRNKVYWTC
jgi:hypothetical protein